MNDAILFDKTVWPHRTRDMSPSAPNPSGSSTERPLEQPPSAKRAGAITVVGQIAKIAVQFVSLITFSHLLTPRDVGLFAMVAVFLTLGELVRDFGLTQAAIQTPHLSHTQGSNLFWTNFAIGLSLTTALAIAAPAVAHMYGEPALRNVAPWVALSFTINALQTQFQVRLIRDLRFMALTVTETISQFVGLAAGLIAALAGASFWSLVVQMLAAYSSLLVQRALIADWWPGRPRRESGMRALYTFGFHSALSQLMSYFAANADSYIIGIQWGAGALGIYNRAYQMFTVPANQLLAPLTNVALPLLSRRHHEGEDFYSLLRKAQIVISGTLTLAFALVAALASPIVHLALGDTWKASATLLPILAIGGAAQVLSYVNLWAFLTLGNTKQLFYSSLVTRPLIILCIAVGSLAGLRGVAWGLAAGLCMSWLISLTWLKFSQGMPVAMFFAVAIHTLIAGSVAGGLGWIFVQMLADRLHPLAVLSLGALMVSTIYGALLTLNPAIRRTILNIGKPALRRVRSVGSGRRS